MLRLNRLWFTAALVMAAFLLAMCTVSPAANPPRERPTPAVPSPVPTAKALPAQLFVSLAYGSPAPLHGAPPFTANFIATVYGDPSLLRTCQTMHWQFGDGAEETQPCAAKGEQLYEFKIKHTYTQTGTYHATASIALTDGHSVESDKTQTIIVAFPQPTSPMEPIIFWGVWGVTLLAAAAAFVWLRRKSRRAKIIGYAAIALGLVSFVPPFSYLPNPAGLVWAMLGNYTYDPRLPFANRFVIAGDPTARLRPLLDRLVPNPRGTAVYPGIFIPSISANAHHRAAGSAGRCAARGDFRRLSCHRANQ